VGTTKTEAPYIRFELVIFVAVAGSAPHRRGARDGACVSHPTDEPVVVTSGALMFGRA
jgi:hypothetical protein